mmetsp:Transcript_3693/g.9389  ORF Transcript_3693/g.9389 Transcript_3693/m.9389 type:complete len:429 (+) Transcript_3693:96-1382(+)
MAPPKDGASIRAANAQKHTQDLLYRTEYLATLASGAASIDAAQAQAIQGTLTSAPMKELLAATATRAAEILPPSEQAPKDVLLSVGTMLEASPNPQAHEALKDVQHVHEDEPRLALAPSQTLDIESLLNADHVHVLAFEIARHASNCRHVQAVYEEAEGGATVDYAGFYLQRSKVQAGLNFGLTKPRRWHRLDGQSNVGSAHKYSLFDGGSLLVRTECEGRHPFNSRALASSSEPAAISSEGHYFEVRIKQIFRPEGELNEPRLKSDSLIIGFTATCPTEVSSDPRTCKEVPRTWAISSAGRFYSSPPAPEVGRISRSVSPQRVKEQQVWHRKPAKTEQLTCPWPAAPPTAGQIVTKQVAWSKVIGEGDRVGLLATPFGGAVLYVNGVKELLIPDARIAVDRPLYPVLEVFNHIRSVELLGDAPMPKQ